MRAFIAADVRFLVVGAYALGEAIYQLGKPLRAKTTLFDNKNRFRPASREELRPDGPRQALWRHQGDHGPNRGDLVARSGHIRREFYFEGLMRQRNAKRTPEGRAERLALLAAAGVGDLARVRALGAAPDDILDAAVLALTARRVADGTAVRLGDGAVDARGLRMEVAY